MKKIDELIDDLNWLLYVAIPESHRYELMQTVIKRVEELKPYIELGTYFSNPKYWDEEYLLNDGKEEIAANLLKQIREQENG